MMGDRQKLEHSVGLEVVISMTGVLVESETWLSGTGGISGLSGSDIIRSETWLSETGGIGGLSWSDIKPVGRGGA